MASGRAWRTECQNALTVWPERMRPDASVTVPETITGSRSPVCFHQFVEREDRGLGVERVEDGLDQEQVGAAFEQARRLLVVRRAQLVEAHVARAGSLTSGLMLAVRGVGPRAPATKRGLSGVLNLSAGRARDARRGEVHLARERAPGRSPPARREVAPKVLVSMRSAPAAR